MTETFQIIPLELLHESKLNPRRHFDEAKLAELTASVREKGILCPLIVRRVHDGKRSGARHQSSAYEIAAGHRRFRAAAAVGLDAVPCIVRDLSDDEFLEVLTVENLQREDVHPLDEALGYRELLSRPGYDVARIAARVGKSESYVAKRLKLNDLVQDAKQLYWDETIGLGQAVQLARLEAEQQEKLLKQWPKLSTCEGVFSPSKLAGIIEREFHLHLSRAPFDLDSTTLLSGAGDCTRCPKQTGYNRALFDDIDDDATCTDRSCYEQKCENHMRGLLKQRPELLQVSEEWGEKVSGAVVPAGKWNEAKGRKRGAKDAIIIDGHRKGTVLAVLLEAERPGATSGADLRKANERERLRAVNREREIRGRVIGAAAATVTQLSGPDLRLVLAALAHGVGSDKLRWVMKRYGWLGKGDYPSADELLRRAGGEEKMHLALVMDLAMVQFSFVYSFQTPKPKDRPAELLVTVQRHGIDISQIEAEVAATEKPPAAKKTAKTRESSLRAMQRNRDRGRARTK